MDATEGPLDDGTPTEELLDSTGSKLGSSIVGRGDEMLIVALLGTSDGSVVTGQIVVVTAMIEVTTAVPSVGQSVTPVLHLVTV